MTRKHRLAAVTALPLLLAAAACGDDSSDSADGDTATGGGDDELTIDIADPTDGAEVGESFDMAFDVGVPLGEPDTGRHHIHVYYDGATEQGDYDLVYEDSFTVERALGPGEHEVEAVIANADHSLTDASDTVTVTVGDGATGSSGDDTEDTEDTGDGTGSETGTETESDNGGYDY